jgi:hypothetical protein
LGSWEGNIGYSILFGESFLNLLLVKGHSRLQATASGSVRQRTVFPDFAQTSKPSGFYPADLQTNNSGIAFGLTCPFRAIFYL